MTQDLIFVYILLIHFVADFALQTHEQAIKKSTSFLYLTLHVGVYSSIWLIALLPFLGLLQATYLAVITFVTHSIIDAVTSRIGKPFWAKQDLHNGFVVVGFDQMLHYLQLYFTLKLFL